MNGDDREAAGLPTPAPEDIERWQPSVPPDHARHPDVSVDAAAVWTGLVWGRLGRCDLAWPWWDAVEDDDLAAWVAAERGRVLREFGLHERARQLEEAALPLARDVTDIVTLRLSLAADAVGLGRAERAARQLGAAVALLGELPDGPRAARQRLRATWVAVEVAIAAGERPRAVGLPTRGESGPVFPADHVHGTDFHRAKGLLFAGIVREDAALFDHAARLAPPMLTWAVELARHDVGDRRAADRAVAAWRAVRPPPGFETVVAATPTAVRIGELA